jgi:serine/threonine protein kinase
MGDVYRARDTRLDRPVALKFLSGEYTQNSERVRRFKQEAMAASALNHPNILTILEAGEAEGHQFIATEFVDGESLRQILNKSGRLPMSEALSITAQVASALAAAHQAGIVHRDVKPDNVMVRRDHYVKVVDFGIAKLAPTSDGRHGDRGTSATESQTQTGVILGTVPYMSPEQARGQAVDTRADIWSLGCLLYEMLTGRSPFAGASTTDVLVAILEKEPVAISERLTATPPEVDWIVGKTLRKNPAERYQTMAELLGDVRRLQQKLDFE